MSYILIDPNSSISPYLNVSNNSISYKWNPLEATFYSQLRDAVRVKDEISINRKVLIKKITWQIDDCIDLNTKLNSVDKEIVNLKQNREKLIKDLSNE